MLDFETHQDRVRILMEFSERQNHRCPYCAFTMHKPGSSALAVGGSDLMTFEHVVPKSQGGCDCQENLIVACKKCNNLRSNRHPVLFKRVIDTFLTDAPLVLWHRQSVSDCWYIQAERRVLWKSILDALNDLPNTPCIAL